MQYSESVLENKKKSSRTMNFFVLADTRVKFEKKKINIGVYTLLEN